MCAVRPEKTLTWNGGPCETMQTPFHSSPMLQVNHLFFKPLAPTSHLMTSLNLPLRSHIALHTCDPMLKPILPRRRQLSISEFLLV